MPRFGAAVLSEIASRALSPAVNDPGTAVDVISRAARVLAVLDGKSETKDVKYPKLFVAPVTVEDLFDDLFLLIARDCERVDAGDHVILIGKIEAFENSGKTGLGYARGGYFTPALTEKNLLSNVEGSLSVGAVAERAGEVLLVPDADGGWTLPFVDKAESESMEVLEPQFSAEIGLSIQTGLLYSIYEDTKSGHQHIVYLATLGKGRRRSVSSSPFSNCRSSKLEILPCVKRSNATRRKA